MKIELVETRRITLKPGKTIELNFSDEKYLIMLEILSGLGTITKEGKKRKGEKNFYSLEEINSEFIFEYLCGTYTILAKTTLKMAIKKINFLA